MFGGLRDILEYSRSQKWSINKVNYRRQCVKGQLPE